MRKHASDVDPLDSTAMDSLACSVRASARARRIGIAILVAALILIVSLMLIGQRYWRRTVSEYVVALNRVELLLDEGDVVGALKLAAPLAKKAERWSTLGELFDVQLGGDLFKAQFVEPNGAVSVLPKHGDNVAFSRGGETIMAYAREVDADYAVQFYAANGSLLDVWKPDFAGRYGSGAAISTLHYDDASCRALVIGRRGTGAKTGFAAVWDTRYNVCLAETTLVCLPDRAELSTHGASGVSILDQSVYSNALLRCDLSASEPVFTREEYDETRVYNANDTLYFSVRGGVLTLGTASGHRREISREMFAEAGYYVAMNRACICWVDQTTIALVATPSYYAESYLTYGQSVVLLVNALSSAYTAVPFRSAGEAGVPYTRLVCSKDGKTFALVSEADGRTSLVQRIRLLNGTDGGFAIAEAEGSCGVVFSSCGALYAEAYEQSEGAHTLVVSVLLDRGHKAYTRVIDDVTSRAGATGERFYAVATKRGERVYSLERGHILEVMELQTGLTRMSATQARLEGEDQLLQTFDEAFGVSSLSGEPVMLDMPIGPAVSYARVSETRSLDYSADETRQGVAFFDENGASVACVWGGEGEDVYYIASRQAAVLIGADGAARLIPVLSARALALRFEGR